MNTLLSFQSTVGVYSVHGRLRISHQPHHRQVIRTSNKALLLPPICCTYDKAFRTSHDLCSPAPAFQLVDTCSLRRTLRKGSVFTRMLSKLAPGTRPAFPGSQGRSQGSFSSYPISIPWFPYLPSVFQIMVCLNIVLETLRCFIFIWDASALSRNQAASISL